MKRVAFLGPSGTFTEEALTKCSFSEETVFQPYNSIPEVILAVAEGEVKAGLVPTENSLEGAVNISLDMLVHKVDLQINREVVLPISHNLFSHSGIKLEDVERVYSHPQALAQCRDFILQKMPQAIIHSTSSTSEAFRLVKNSQEKWGAIGNKRAGEIYGLSCLGQAIQDNNDNYTRFLLLAESDHSPTGCDKTSLAFAQDKDRPGGLYSIMGEFALRNINLTRIESRPSRKMLGEYIFFLDFIGHREDTLVQKALQALQEKTTFLKVLGSYPQYIY